MKPADLQRKHLTALITGDLAEAAELRKQFRADSHTFALDFMRAAAAVCLEYRFGPGAGIGASPVDFDELAAFMAEIRSVGAGTEPKPDYLAIEAVVRSLYGEQHLYEALDSHQRSQAIYTALHHQIQRYKWIRAEPVHTIERARWLTILWMGVTPSIS